jgi:hypothetical protein
MSKVLRTYVGPAYDPERDWTSKLRSRSGHKSFEVWTVPDSQLERESSRESARLPPGLGCQRREQNVIFCHYHITGRKSKHISYLAIYTLANHKSLDAAI